MLAYTLRRLLYGVPILLGVSIIVFALIQLAPGDAASLLIPPEPPKEGVDQIRAKLGLDKPMYVQYLLCLGRLVRGDLGSLIVTNMPGNRQHERHIRRRPPLGRPFLGPRQLDVTC